MRNGRRKYHFPFYVQDRQGPGGQRRYLCAAQRSGWQRQTVAGSDGFREASESRDDLGLAVSDIQSFVQSVKRNLNFSIDDSSGQVVVKVIDGDSGEVVRQIPSEEVLKLAARLDDVRSVLFETRA